MRERAPARKRARHHETRRRREDSCRSTSDGVGGIVAIASLLTFTSSVRPSVSAVTVCGLVLVLAASSFSVGRAMVRAQYGSPTSLMGVTWQPSPTLATSHPDGKPPMVQDVSFVLYHRRDLPDSLMPRSSRPG